MRTSLAKLLIAASLAAGVGAVQSGCTFRGGGAVWVTDTAPPPNPHVVVDVRPGWVWIDGYWQWQNRWVWHVGHWERERVGWYWSPGAWVSLHNRWEWTPGRWERGHRRPVRVEPRPQPRPRVRDHR